MAQVNKIDSNIVGFAYAEEAALGFLPGENGHAGTPVWRRLNPNSFSDFGGEIVTTAPNPINPSRQRRKGVTTDLNASGGFNHNLSYHNLTDLMQGVVFADIRRKGHQVPTGITSTKYNIANTAGFLVRSLVFAQGFDVLGNNGLRMPVTAVTSNTSITIADLTSESNPPDTATIDVIGFSGDSGDISVAVSSGFPTLTSTSLDFTTLGLVIGQWIFIGGDNTSHRFTNTLNNGFKRVRAITDNILTFDKSDTTMVTESGSSKNIRLFFGDVLRNEKGTLIKRRSYNKERTLGVPDDAQPSQVQSELLIGSVPNEFTLNVPSAELVNVDFSFVSTDSIQRDGTTGPKQTNVVSAISSKEYNTSSDVGRIRLSSVSKTDANPTPLFAFITEAAITINNNVTPNKAVGVLGAFEVTAGTFTVSGSITAYFGNVTAVQSVRNNSDVSLDLSFAKDNTAIVFDLPLIALGDGRLNIETDEPITLPLTTDAASGEDIDENLDHTVCITYFNYTPDLAVL